MLNAIIRTVLTEAAASDSDTGFNCFPFLLHLSKVPRFDMTVMCLPSRDKMVLKDMWDKAVKVWALSTLEVDLDSLRKAYKL